MTSEGGRHLDAGAKTVTDDSPSKVAVIKAKEALMKRIYSSTRLEIARKVASDIICSLHCVSAVVVQRPKLDKGNS